MKKKTVKLVSAVVILGVLCAAYEGVNFYVTSQEEKETEENDTSVDLVSLEADDITAVSFTADQNEVEFDKKDDSWTEKSDANFPVNQDTVDSAVKGVASLTADQEISDVEDMSQYDLDNPQNTITLTTADGDTSLQIGMESSNNQYYVKKADDDKNVYLVSSTSIEPFMGTLYDFAESGTFPSVTSATITDVKVDKENSYELTQDADNLFWNVSDGKTTEKADTTKAGTVTSAVGSLAYDKFVDYNCTDDSKYGFDDPYAVITVKYTEEEAVESDEDSEADENDSEATDEAATDTSEDADASDEDSSEDEQETQTVEKTLTIYVGDETGDDRYVKVDDSKEVYTITKDSLTDILDSTMSDFYNLTVSYVSSNDLDSLEVQSADGDHTINIVTETVKAEDEDTTDDTDSDTTDESSTETSDESSTDTDSSDESSSDDEEETTTTTYKLDGEDLDESTFTTFYNKLINMTAQERLTEEYTPEGDPAYTFIFKDTDGKETTVKYYEYDTNFYAAVVEDKVYLVNKMNVKDLDEAYQKMVNPDTEDAEESTSDTATEEN